MTRIRQTLASCAWTLGLLAPAAAPTAAQTSPDTFRLKEIVVTATRLPAPREAVPAAVSVLHGDDLRARGVRFVAEALRTVPGATIARNGSLGGITSLFLRGGESDYVQVLIDGVPVNEPGGAFDFGQLTTQNVDRIEVVRGPASVLYGSDAVAGVVQIFTIDGQGASQLSASATAGRSRKVGRQAEGGYGTGAWDVAARGRGPVAYSFAASGYDTDGAYAFNNDYTNRTLSGRVRVGSSERTGIALSARRTDNTYHYPTDGAGALVDLNQFATGESLALGLDAGHFLAPRLEARLLLALHDFERITDDQPDGPSDTLGFFASRNESRTHRRSADVRANLYLGAVTVLTVGGVTERQEGETRFESRSQFGPFESETDDARSNRAAYAQLVTAPTHVLTLTSGVRREDNEQFGGFTTYRVGANLRVVQGTVVRASAGTAFKAPTFFENFAEGFVRGNRELQPERSRSWELGLEQELLQRRATIAAMYFDQRFRNLIQFTGQPPEPGAPNYFNVGSAEANGVELTGRIAVSAGLDVVGSYTHVRTDVLDEGYGNDRAFVAGRPLLRRPRHTASLTAGHDLGARARTHVTVQYVGAREDLDFSDPVELSGSRVLLPAHTTVDVAAEYTLLQGGARLSDLALTLKLENAFDERYEEIRNFPAPSRVVLLGVSATLGF